MPRRKRLEKATKLSFRGKYELLIGPNPRNRVFEDDDERRAAWELHHDQIRASCSHRPGIRPWAQLVFDLGLPADIADSDALVALAERGELAPWEQRELVALADHPALADRYAAVATAIKRKENK